MYIQSQVYSDTFKNPPYSVPQREQVYTTPIYKPKELKETDYVRQWSETSVGES